MNDPKYRPVPACESRHCLAIESDYKLLIASPALVAGLFLNLFSATFLILIVL